jgi:glycosyltransferase involved in cell wall biosynthesis
VRRQIPSRTRARRVTFFHCYPHALGGSQRVVRTYALALRASGRDADVILPGPGPFAEALARDGVPVVRVDAPKLLRVFGGSEKLAPKILGALGLPIYWWRIARHLRVNRPDLLHVNDHRGIVMAGPAAFVLRIPLVWHVHGIYRSNLLTRLVVLLAAVVITPSAAAAEATLSHGTKRPDCRIVPNWLDHMPEVQSAPDLDQPTLVVCAAVARPEKGIDVLIRATGILRLRHRSLRLAIAGGGQPGHEGYYRGLHELVSSLGLEQAVEFEGFKSDVFAGWNYATVYVQPSRSETFGLAVLEAMTAGLAVVVTDAGGLPELVIDNESGIVVPRDDPAALARGISRVIEDANLRHTLIDSARRRATATYSEARGLENLLEAYTAALGAEF